MHRLYRTLDGINETLGRFVAWFTLLMVLIQFILVLMRYVFSAADFLGVSSLWWQEAIVYLHGALIMLGAGYTFLHNGHVRVDIIYREASEKKKDWTDLLGSLLFLLPVCYIIWWSTMPNITNAWPELYVVFGDSFVVGDPAKYINNVVAPDAREGGAMIMDGGALQARLEQIIAAAGTETPLDLPGAVRKLMSEDPGAFLGSEPVAAAVAEEVRSRSWGFGPILPVGGEGSTEASGIPAKWALKTTILLLAVVLAIQAVSTAIKAAMRLAGHEVYDPHRTEESLD